MPCPDQIAVVIPAGPGERAWEGLLPLLGRFGERVVSAVQGDDLSAGPGHLVVTGPAGRARQLNAGAAATSLPWLFFIHADSRPDRRLAEAATRLPDGEFIAYGRLRFYDGPRLMRINEAGAWLRSRMFGLPFGDQGMLMPRKLFQRLGGFDEGIDCGEDHALVWAARHAGVPVRPLAAPMPTSARRYAEHGWWRVTRRHLALSWSQANSWRRGRAPTGRDGKSGIERGAS